MDENNKKGNGIGLFILLATIFLVPNLVLADGGLIVRPIVLKSIAETHQIATIRLDSNQKTAETNLFVSLTDLSTESHDLKFFVPFKDKPTYFNVVDTTLDEFLKEQGIDKIDEKIAEHERLKNEIKDHYIGSLLIPGLLITPASLAYFYISGSSFMGPSEVLQFGTSRVEIYQIISETDLNTLIQEVGLPENIASKYKEYGSMYIYLINMKSSPILTSSASNLQQNCPETYEQIINYIREHKEVIAYMWEPIPREAYIFVAQCPQAENEIINLFREIFTPTERVVKGVKITWKSSLIQKSDEFFTWYPLGTGKLWEHPIHLTKIYVFPGDFKSIKLSYPSTKVSLSRDVYLVKLENTNPSTDLEIYSRGELLIADMITAFFSQSIKSFAFGLLSIANSWAVYPIVLVTFITSWIVGFKLFSIYILKKDFILPDLIKESLLSLGVFIVSSWIGTIAIGLLAIPLMFIGAWFLIIPVLLLGAFAIHAFYNKSRFKVTWKRGFIMSLLLLVKSLLVFGVIFGLGYVLILDLSTIVF